MSTLQHARAYARFLRHPIRRTREIPLIGHSLADLFDWMLTSLIRAVVPRSRRSDRP